MLLERNGVEVLDALVCAKTPDTKINLVSNSFVYRARRANVRLLLCTFGAYSGLFLVLEDSDEDEGAEIIQ